MHITEAEVEKLIHEMISLGQSFNSYAQLLDNPSLHINHKKMQEIARKCAKNCLTIRNILVEETHE